MSTNETYVVSGYKIYVTTDNAIFIGPPGLRNTARDNARKEWIPIDLISHRTAHDVGQVGDFEIPLWLAEKKNLLPL